MKIYIASEITNSRNCFVYVYINILYIRICPVWMSDSSEWPWFMMNDSWPQDRHISERGRREHWMKYVPYSFRCSCFPLTIVVFWLFQCLVNGIWNKMVETRDKSVLDCAQTVFSRTDIYYINDRYENIYSFCSVSSWKYKVTENKEEMQLSSEVIGPQDLFFLNLNQYRK